MKRYECGISLARAIRLWVGIGALNLAGTVLAGNVAPYSESFENYAHGYLITNVTGWSAAVSNAGVVSTNLVAVGALTTYTNAGYGLPIPAATHAKVLEMSEALTNSVATTTGGVVIVDLVALPAQRDDPPAGSVNHQFACYFNTNSQLVVWHYDSNSMVNAWLALTNSPTNEIASGAWSRLTVWQDYSNKLFQVAVNGHAPLTDAKGWTSGGVSQPGTWFRMVGTNNAYLSRFRHQGELTAYLDDLLVTNRVVSLNATNFAEAVANDGRIATTNILTLYGDTFANTTYASNTHFTASGVPAGLNLALGYLNPTQLVVSLSGQAAPHTAAASTNSMALSLLGPAFTLDRAADVGGSTQSGLSVTFADPPVLTCSTNRFDESAFNDGSIGNTVLITLAGGETFTNVSPLIAGTHYTTSGIPAGLSLLLTTNSATQLTATLTGNALDHGSNNSTNFNLTFLDGAFAHVAAGNILGSATNFTIEFVGSAELVYSTTTFSEVPANNGTVLGGTINILGDLFKGTAGEDFVASGKVATNHVPAGLGVTMTLNAASNLLTVAFPGAAASHTNANDVADLTFTFLNSAFLNSAAASISNYNRSDLAIDFHDQPVLTYDSGTAFTEAGANDGTIGNTLSVALDGTTFTGANGVFDGTKVTANNVPAGLTAVVTKTGDTTLTVQLTGTATVHRALSNTSSLSLQFHDAAFNTVLTTNIIGVERGDLSVTFNDTAVLAYSTNRFAEVGANDGSVGGGTITLTGDQYAGTNGEVFAASQVAFTNMPAGLTGVVTRTSATLATLSFAGRADSHAASNSVSDLGLTFLTPAFTGGNAPGVTGYSNTTLAIDFDDQPALTYSGTSFAESSLNDGSISNTILFTLTGDTFTNVAFLTAGVHFTTSGVPAGLGVELEVSNPTQVLVRLTGNAAPHTSAANSTMALSFLDAAFVNVAAGYMAGTSATLPVNFDNPPLLTYSGNTFRESNNGAIDNSLTITLSSTTGEAFAGADGNNFAASNWVAVSTLPNYLTAVVTRASAAVLNVTLTGAAVNHLSSDSVTGLTLTFNDLAFTHAKASEVQNYIKNDLRIDFRDSALYVNLVPYRESFELYANGFMMGEEQGWSPGGASVVTSESAIVTALTNAFSEFPITTNHVKVLRLNDDVSDEILSGTGGLLYSDLMLYITAREEAPVGSTNYQFAMYVDTNQCLVVWHRDTSGTPTNTWLTLAGTPAVTTGAWHRVTVVQDQGHFRYQLYLDGSTTPVTNALGYTGPGGSEHPGSWFNMVNQSGYLSRAKVQGSSPNAPGYMDDVTVVTQRPSFVKAAPTVAVPAAANPPVTSGTNTLLTVLGADEDGGGEPNLTYTWSLVSGPASVSFNPNGDNAAKNSTATFGTNGVYGFQVVIRDQDGQMALSPTSGVVSVTVTQAVATFTVSPASLWLFAGATQQFTAANAADQFGIAMSVVPANYEWSAGGAGTIDTGTNVATLVAGATAGSYMVTSRYGTATATASVLVATELVWDGTLNDWQTAHWSNPVGGLTVPQEGISYAVTSGTASATATPFPGAPLRIAAGGTLSVENSATSTGVVTLAGGTVTCAGNYSLSALNGLVAGAGANTIDVAANTLTLPLAVTGAGSLTKQGAGTLRLAGNNTYTGLTTVNNGTLLVDGSLAASGTVSLAGGTLGGTGTVGTVTSSATLSPGHGAAMGTLTVSNLVLTAGCTNAFDLGLVNASDSVAVPGTLTLGGGVITITPQAGLNDGTYTLFSYGITSGNTLPATVPGPGYSLSVVNNEAEHKIQLSVIVAKGSVYKIR